MSRREIFTVVFSAALGFVGGGVSSRMYSSKMDQVPALRATRFELVDAAGKVRAFWGRDDSNNDVLAFRDPKKHSIAAFGVRPEGLDVSPFLDFRGKDGKSRVNVELGWMDRPIFALSDEKWEGRVMLGFVASDYPGPTDADWALTFRYPDLASIGVMRDPINGSLSGTLILNDQKKQLLRVPTVPNHKSFVGSVRP